MSTPSQYLGLTRQGLNAANSITGGGSGSALGDAGTGLGVYQGLSSGSPLGYAGAAVNSAKLANNFGAFGSGAGEASTGLGAAGGALGLYSGIEQGGVGGDTSAALSAAQGAGQVATAAGASGLGTTLAAAGPISLALAPALIGYESQPVTLGAKYWSTLGNNLQGGTKNPNFAGAAEEALNTPQGQVPASIQQAIYNSGFLQPGEAWGMSTTPQEQQAAQGILQQTNQTGKGGNTHQISKNARGGSMKGKSNNQRSARLKELYKKSFTNRSPQHFDGGGYVDYATGAPASSSFDWFPGTASAPSSGENSAGVPTDIAAPDNSGAYGMGYYNDAPGTTGNPAPASSSSGGASSLSSSALSSLGVSSVGQFLQKYGALAPIIAAAIGGNKTASPPATPAGYGAIPSIPTPTNNRSYTQPNVANWYTYGEGPEQSFFSNNQLPNVPGVSPAQSAPAASTGASPTAGSGTSQPVSTIQPMMLSPKELRAGGGSIFNSTAGDDYVSDPGHGDGTSDGVDAKLSGGEYVMDAGTVATLGNGSNEAGARALDQLRQRVRKHAGKQLVKGKQFMKAKAPEAYLKGGS